MARVSDGGSKAATNDNIITGKDFLTTVDVESEVEYRTVTTSKTASEKEVTNVGSEDAPISKAPIKGEEEALETLSEASEEPLVSMDDIYRLKDSIDWDEMKGIYDDVEDHGKKEALTNVLVKGARGGIQEGDIPFVKTICDIVGSSAVNEHFPNAATECLREYKLGSNMDEKELARYGEEELLPALEAITPGWNEQEVVTETGNTEVRKDITAHSAASPDAKKVLAATKSEEESVAISEYFTEETIDDLQSIYRDVKEHL